MSKIFLLLLFCHVSSTVKHSLKYFLTGTYGVQNLPEFLGIVMVDDIQMGYCDSNFKTAEPKLDWMRQLIKDDPLHLKWYSSKCSASHEVFQDNMDRLKKRLNQTGGVHILQRMNGCEWDDETGEVTGFNQYGYDGEDFISLDLNTLTWIAPKSQAVTTKLKWDTDKPRLEFNKNYYIHTCPDWLRRYVGYARNFQQRKDLPSVSLLQKTPSSPVRCFATGFYPDRGMMFWRKDGVEIHEDVEHGEILPNQDGTFQMSVDLDASSVTADDWGRFDCVFQLSGVKEDVVTRLEREKIRTNFLESSSGSAAVIGVFVGLLLVFAFAVGLIIIRRRN